MYNYHVIMKSFSCFRSGYIGFVIVASFFSALVAVESFSTAKITTEASQTTTQLSFIPEQHQQLQCQQRLRRRRCAQVANMLNETLVAGPEAMPQQQQQQERQVEEELRLLSTAAAYYSSKSKDIDNGYLLSPLLSATAQPVTQRPYNKKRIKISPSSASTETSSTKQNKKKTKAQRPAAGLTQEEELYLSFRLRTYQAAVRLRKQVLVAAGAAEWDIATAEMENAWAMACGVSVQDLRRIVHEGQQTRSALVAANVGLVTSIAQKYWTALKYSAGAAASIAVGTTMQDLIQEGNLGLMTAAERFDPARNVRFGTYATWWVRERISRSLADSSRMIRLPVHVIEKLAKIQKAAAGIKAHTGREPGLQELANALEMPVNKFKRLADCRRPIVSLELPLSKTKGENNREVTLGDTLASTAPTPMDDAERVSLQAALQDCLDSELTTTERDVLTHRFGLHTGVPLRIQETADLVGVSRDCVRQLEKRALNKLRSPQRNYKLKHYVGGSSS